MLGESLMEEANWRFLSEARLLMRGVGKRDIGESKKVVATCFLKHVSLCDRKTMHSRVKVSKDLFPHLENGY